MAGCFYYLARHAEARAKVTTEVRAAFSTADEIRLGNKLTSCVYLRACVDESLRMSPPVGGALWREVCEGGLNIHGNMIPRGYDVGIGIYAIQHNPAYYPDPFTYRPERWIVGEKTTQEEVVRAKDAFSAFSIGPVGCVGKNLAYAELMLTMARVLYALDIKPAAETVPEAPPKSYLKGYPLHTKHEYRLRDRFTSWKDGPMVAFRVAIK